MIIHPESILEIIKIMQGLCPASETDSMGVAEERVIVRSARPGFPLLRFARPKKMMMPHDSHNNLPAMLDESPSLNHATNGLP